MRNEWEMLIWTNIRFSITFINTLEHNEWKMSALEFSPFNCTQEFYHSICDWLIDRSFLMLLLFVFQKFQISLGCEPRIFDSEFWWLKWRQQSEEVSSYYSECGQYGQNREFLVFPFNQDCFSPFNGTFSNGRLRKYSSVAVDHGIWKLRVI